MARSTPESTLPLSLPSKRRILLEFVSFHLLARILVCRGMEEWKGDDLAREGILLRCHVVEEYDKSI